MTRTLPGETKSDGQKLIGDGADSAATDHHRAELSRNVWDASRSASGHDNLRHITRIGSSKLEESGVIPKVSLYAAVRDILSHSPHGEPNKPGTAGRAESPSNEKPDRTDSPQRGGQDKASIVTTVEASEQDKTKAVLLDPRASAQDKLKAVEALASRGVTELSLVDADGTKRLCRLEIEQAGSRSLVHLFAQGEDGREHVVLRGVRNADGSFEHERDARGREVSFTGSWWSSHVGQMSALSAKDVGDPAQRTASFTDGPSRHRMDPRVQDREKPRTGDDLLFEPFGQSGANTTDALYDPRVVSASRARGTGYFPSNDPIEGGYVDRKGHKLYTLQDYLAGRAPYVSVAMDVPAARYGSMLRIPELEAQHGGIQIPFRVVDTGSAFRGRGRSRIDICTVNRHASNDSTVNGPLTLLFLA